MKKLRMGVAGVGGMGGEHCRSLLAGKVPDCELAAICDVDPAALARFPGVRAFSGGGEMFRSGEIDAVLIATPHYTHTGLGIAALEAGLHVLVEKPISVHKADCERLLAAHRSRRQVFAAMFNQRTDPHYQKVRHLVRSGELGKIRRINWIITDWFRTEAYYASGGWRATWAGEGGGVLLNQCPHNLDLWQWIFGLPARVRGFCQLGRYHDIEVEDDVTAYLEYPDGATGVFIASTGEAPGTNRLELAAEQGRLVLEAGKLSYVRNEIPAGRFSRETDAKFSMPPAWLVDIPLGASRGEQHAGILKNFVNAILKGEKLLSPAAEGIRSVELGNAILMSSFLGETVRLPIDGAKYERVMKKLIATSKFKKKVVRKTADSDIAKSFGLPAAPGRGES